MGHGKPRDPDFRPLINEKPRTKMEKGKGRSETCRGGWREIQGNCVDGRRKETEIGIKKRDINRTG